MAAATGLGESLNATASDVVDLHIAPANLPSPKPAASRYPLSRKVLAVFAIIFMMALSCLITGVVTYHATFQALDPVPKGCIETPEAFVAAFSLRNVSSALLEEAACVSGLMGLVQRFPGAQLNNQAARRISFAFSDSALEKVLVYGVNGGREIVDLLGLGYVPAPSTFRLLVWRDESDRHTRGFWENLQGFLELLYGDALPHVGPAIETIRTNSFASLTGCNVEVLQTEPGNFAKANCSQAYQDASALFVFGQACDAPAQTFGSSYSTRCRQEQNLLSRRDPPPTALELRAFLYNVNGFNSLFTGYGYTAEEYDGPLVREFWVENVEEASLSERDAVDFHVLRP